MDNIHIYRAYKTIINIQKNKNINIAFRTNNTLNNIVNNKLEETNNVGEKATYKITCNLCN